MGLSLTVPADAPTLTLPQRERGILKLARLREAGIAPLVFAPVTTERDLDGRALIDVSASDRLLDLAPEGLAQPAPLDHELEPRQGEALGGQRRRGIGALGVADGVKVQPGHQPVGRDLEHRLGHVAVQVRLVRHIRGNPKNPTVLRPPPCPPPEGEGLTTDAPPPVGRELLWPPADRSGKPNPRPDGCQPESAHRAPPPPAVPSRGRSPCPRHS